jgi:hypothetical protein
MQQTRSWLVALALAIGLAVTVIVLLLAVAWTYTTVQLDLASAQGVYPSAEAAMLALIDRSYQQPEDVQIIYAGTNSFDGSDPHVWYAIACVWGGTRRDGSPVGSARHDYDQPGIYFLATQDGWVFVPEGALPEFIGYWMEVFGLAGAGSSTPSHNWGDNPDKGCIF